MSAIADKLPEAYKDFQTAGRFFIERTDDPGAEWTVVDYRWSAVVGFERRIQADCFAVFCRAYVKRHGDISLYSAPYGIDTPFTDRDRFMNRHFGSEPGEGFYARTCGDSACECARAS